MSVAIAVCELARAALPAQGRRVAVQVLPKVAQGLLARQEDVPLQWTFAANGEGTKTGQFWIEICWTF